jgi:hypothetical protein
VDRSPAKPAADFAAVEDQDQEMADAADEEADDETEDELPVPSLVRRRRSADGDDGEDEDEDVSMSSSPARTPQVMPALPLSSSLSSAPDPQSKAQRTRREENTDVDADGDVSDATSATVPRSDLSEIEGSDSEADRPAASPSVASRQSGSPVKKRKGKPGPKLKSGRASSKDATSTSTSSRPTQVRRPTGRKNRILSSPISDQETSSPARPSRSPVARTHRPVPPTSAAKSSPTMPAREQLKEEPRAVVPDQVVAPMADAAEIAPANDDMAVNPADALPAVVSETPGRPATPPLDELVQETASTVPRERTPSRESTLPREPTPEPPKKVSLSEYLQSLKMKKVETPADGVVNGDDAGTLRVAPAASTEGNSETPAEPAKDSTAVKAETNTSGQVNFLEFLPSSRGSVDATPLTPAAAATALPNVSPVLTATPGSYVPRQEYFPPQQAPTPQASSSYVPRQVSSSYVPRSAAPPTDESPVNPAVTPSYVPRQLSTEGSSPHVARLADDRLTSTTPPKYPSVSPDVSTSALPPVLPQRDPPPHAAAPPSNTPARNPPTGPRNPPTGPRGFPPPSPVNRPIELSGPGNVSSPMSNVHALPPARGNFVPGPRFPGGRGGFSRGGGDRFEGERPGYVPFRGRGGFRGRGRGG